VDGILIAEPVAALDSVVGVPAPVVGVHVPQGGVDASLCGHGVRAGGEELGDAGGLEALFDEPEGSAESGSSCAHHHGIVGVVDHSVLLEESVLGGGGLTSASLLGLVLPQTEKGLLHCRSSGLPRESIVIMADIS
jgi:hypothetical protein